MEFNEEPWYAFRSQEGSCETLSAADIKPEHFVTLMNNISGIENADSYASDQKLTLQVERIRQSNERAISFLMLGQLAS